MFYRLWCVSFIHLLLNLSLCFIFFLQNVICFIINAIIFMFNFLCCNIATLILAIFGRFIRTSYVDNHTICKLSFTSSFPTCINVVSLSWPIAVKCWLAQMGANNLALFLTWSRRHSVFYNSECWYVVSWVLFTDALYQFEDIPSIPSY